MLLKDILVKFKNINNVSTELIEISKIKSEYIYYVKDNGFSFECISDLDDDISVKVDEISHNISYFISELEDISSDNRVTHIHEDKAIFFMKQLDKITEIINNDFSDIKDIYKIIHECEVYSPYREVILNLRDKHLTQSQIKDVLEQKYGYTISLSLIKKIKR